MKIFILVFLLPIFSWAADCKLSNPIKLTKEIFAEDIKLKNILLSETPKFPSVGNYNPLTDTLDMDIHALNSQGQGRSRYIGVTLVAPRSGAWMGFAYQYDSEDKYEGSLQQVDDVLAIHSLEVPDNSGKVTEAFLTVENDFITSIMLTYPVYKEEVFTGVNQTVCIVTAVRAP